jgi:hypothetical protein
MLMTITKDVWKNRDNEFSLLLESTDPDGVKAPLDTSLVTQVMLEFKDVGTLTVVREAADAAINWWDAGLDPGELRFALGDFAATLPVGAFPARLTIYSLATPDGIVWASFARRELMISIHDTDMVTPAMQMVWSR